MKLGIYRASEAELVEKCKKHDRHAQKYLYDLYASKMYALACRYVKEKMEAEDVMITSFTKVFERVSQYKGDGSFEGWIRRIVVNESLTCLRKSKAMYIELDIAAADHQPDYDQLESQLGEEELMKLIEELPAGYRVVFNMYAIDGFSHKEIAVQLGISENTSKSQLSRARALLQRNLLELERGRVKNTNGYE